jgi:hypothetical protein
VGDSLFGDKVFSGPQGMDKESFMPFLCAFAIDSHTKIMPKTPIA